MTKITKYLGIFLFLLPVMAHGQTSYIKGRCFKGVVFDTSVVVLKSIKDQKTRQQLTSRDIERAELLLKKRLPILNRPKVNQGEECPIIDQKLKKYYRQYVGFLNQKGETIIWINLFWNKDLIKSAQDNIIWVNDGCSYYWDVEVNITTGEVTNLEINGMG